MTPKVSVVTTVYNGEPYVDRAIPGILGQTFEDFEWILVDDGSQDRTPEILRDLARRDSRVRVFSPGRLGISVAANYGVTPGQGEYIARQDFDDRSYPTGCGCRWRTRRAPEGRGRGRPLRPRGRKPRRALCAHAARRARRHPRDDGQGVPFANTLVAFRRQAWIEAGGYPQVPDLEDLLFFVEVARSAGGSPRFPSPWGSTSFIRPAFFTGRSSMPSGSGHWHGRNRAPSASSGFRAGCTYSRWVVTRTPTALRCSSA